AREAEEKRQREAQAQAQALAERNKTRDDSKEEPEEAPRRPVKSPGAMVSSAGVSYGGPFAEAKGKLPWPVDGRLLARFGEARGDDARSTWDGVMINAAAGSQVHAVHGGRVVFADWLRGSGLLVIL